MSNFFQNRNGVNKILVSALIKQFSRNPQVFSIGGKNCQNKQGKNDWFFPLSCEKNRAIWAGKDSYSCLRCAQGLVPYSKTPF